MADNNSSKPSSSRRNFLKIGAGVLAAGAAVAAATVSQIPLVSADGGSSQHASKLQAQLSTTQSQLSSTQSQLTTTQQQSTSLQTQLQTMTGFLELSISEQALVEAIAETIIPSDSSGPGAKEAGAIYFIDRQLAGDYGRSGGMYMQGPFVPAGLKHPITVQGITYSAGTQPQPYVSGMAYQYSVDLRTFWRFGLAALEAYSNTAYGGNFESLSAANKTAALQDLFNNKPTTFNQIVPSDFANEVFFMTWCGFLMDPIHGGNNNLVGWTHVAFNGVNTGNFYGEGMTTKQLMVATSPTRLRPASLGQLEQGA